MKNLFYSVSVISFLIMTSIFVAFQRDAPQFALRDRTDRLAFEKNWKDTKLHIENLQDDVAASPYNYNAKIALAQAYFKEGKVTGEGIYYGKAALFLLEQVLKIVPENMEALCSKAEVLNSLRYFAKALSVAEIALGINPNEPKVYELLYVSHKEMGHYDIALNMADKLVNLSPGIISYSYLAEISEIFGNTQQAIETMQMAVTMSYPGLESSAEVRVKLGILYENVGNLVMAEKQYRAALEEKDNYAYAMAGMGNIEKAKGNYDKALGWYRTAASIISDPDFDIAISGIYSILYDHAHSYASAKKAIDKMNIQSGKEKVFYYAEKNLSLAYLKVYNYEEAFKHANEEFERRPENIEVCEALAWVCFKRGDLNQANSLIKKAMRTNSRNPVLLYRAGLIHLNSGKSKSGLTMINKALNINPFIERDLATERSAFLALK